MPRRELGERRWFAFGRALGRPLPIAMLAVSMLLGPACGSLESRADESLSAASDERDALANERRKMVELQLESRDIEDERVLAAMRAVPRHRFAPELPDPRMAYDDRPYPIGRGQTISQPYVVALMSQLASVEPPCKVLEVGTGSGYQAAVLAEMGCLVYSIEIKEPLARHAETILAEQGYGDRVHVQAGDGYRGWPEQAPFDAILVTAAAPRIPEPLRDQLRLGGRLVIPVGNNGGQVLEVHRRTEQGFVREKVSAVRFVPMTGEIRRSE